MGLRSPAGHWLEFQIEVLVRRSRHRLGKIDERLELLDGLSSPSSTSTG
jgi:topoisomerase IV subunit A